MWLRREEVLEIKDKIRNLLIEKINEREPPDRIWFTDTVYCGRKKIFQIIGNKAIRFNEAQINKIWFGLIVGAELEKIGLIREMVVEYKGIRGKIDVLYNGEPVEIKSATKMYVALSEYAEVQVEQLSRYCLAVNKETGILIHYIPHIKISNLPVYRYYFDLDKVKKVFDERIEKLNLALEAGDPFILPATWHSQDLNNWECKECVFLPACSGGKIVLNCKM